MEYANKNLTPIELIWDRFTRLCEEENLNAIKDIIGDSDWEQLPYNEMAGAKYKMLGMEYNL